MPGCCFKLGCSRMASIFRIEGDAMMRESPAAKAAMKQVLAQPGVSLIADLTACDYLDSTWLGSILDLYLQYGRDEGRFTVAADAQRRERLFGATHLDRVIRFIDESPAIEGEWICITPGAVAAEDLARHVLECHVQLSNADTPQKKQFASIASQLQRELETVK